MQEVRSAAAMQLCHGGSKEVINSTYMNGFGCVPIKLYCNNSGEQDLAHSPESSEIILFWIIVLSSSFKAPYLLRHIILTIKRLPFTTV